MTANSLNPPKVLPRAAAHCYGNASPDDDHLVARIVAVDDQIIEWLEQRDRARRRTQQEKR